MVQIKLRDGEVTIYTRPDSASYWVSLHLRAARYVLERRKQRCPNATPDDFIMALPDGTLLNTFELPPENRTVTEATI